MRGLLRGIGGLAVLALLAGVMTYLTGFFDSKIPPSPSTARTVAEEVSSVPVTSPETIIEEHATGTVKARDETMISARITATIKTIHVRAGDSVRAGDPLVVLDDREIRARVAQQRESVASARAILEEADPDYQRARALFARGTISRADLDRAQATLQGARARVARAERAVDEALVALSYTTIGSPLNGRVIERYAEPGDTATPGMPLVNVYDPAYVRLEAHVRESLAVNLARGRTLSARIDALDLTVPATVEVIVPAADPGSRSFLVKAALPGNDRLFPGMFGRLILPVGTTNRVVVPARTVSRIGQLEFVTVVTDAGLVRRFVRTGPRIGDEGVEILSGLVAGERVAAR